MQAEQTASSNLDSRVNSDLEVLNAITLAILHAPDLPRLFEVATLELINYASAVGGYACLWDEKISRSELVFESRQTEKFFPVWESGDGAQALEPHRHPGGLAGATADDHLKGHGLVARPEERHRGRPALEDAVAANPARAGELRSAAQQLGIS